jgi:hypothetical protein
MATFARVPVVPGPVLEVYVGDQLFPMHEGIAKTFYPAPEGTRVGSQYDGHAVTAPIDPNESLKAQIRELEASITHRRLGEAILGSDNGWLKQTVGQITLLRAKLT